MKEVLNSSIFFSVMITIIGYELGIFLKKKFHYAIFNPLLVDIIFVILILVIFKVDYEKYNDGAKYLSYLLTPATVCLAIPLYQQLDLLKHNLKAILVGIVSGVFTSLSSVLFLSFIFGLTHEEYVTLLPKSITTAIGMGISEQLGGIVTITVAAIVITGVFGNMMAEWILKIFHIKDSIAKGIAIGTAAHAVGTAKALEMGEIEGAMSSLSITVAGLLTVIGASVFANFI